MEKEADLKVTALLNDNFLYEWWCVFCHTYHYSGFCPLIELYYYDLGNADVDDYYYSLR